MAERRMFSKNIIDSDVFLDMPLSTQALYFHLSMRADDEGFINKPKMVMRMIGASQNELELLLAKRYLLAFDSGVVVVKHWKIHNYIQKDRFKSTLYKEERDMLDVKENKSYTEKELKELDTECVQNGDTGKVRLELGKVSIGKNKSLSKHKFGEYKNVLLTDQEHGRLMSEWGKPETERMIKKLDEGIQLKRYKYSDHNLAIRRWKRNESKSDKPDNFKGAQNFEF